MAIDQLLKRHFWVVTLPATGLSALFGARGFVQVAGMGLAPDNKQLTQPPLLVRTPPSASGTSQHATSADPILARNPFDSQTGPLNAKPVVEEVVAAAPIDLGDPANAPAAAVSQVQTAGAWLMVKTVVGLSRWPTGEFANEKISYRS